MSSAVHLPGPTIVPSDHELAVARYVARTASALERAVERDREQSRAATSDAELDALATDDPAGREAAGRTYDELELEYDRHLAQVAEARALVAGVATHEQLWIEQ